MLKWWLISKICSNKWWLISIYIKIEVEDITTVSHLETNRVEHLYVIIGASVAVVGLIVILVVALVISFRRRKNKEKDEGDNSKSFLEKKKHIYAYIFSALVVSWTFPLIWGGGGVTFGGSLEPKFLDSLSDRNDSIVFRRWRYGYFFIVSFSSQEQFCQFNQAW